MTSDPLFSLYKLGVYEEKLRQRLVNEENLDEKEYPIMVSRYELDGSFYPDVIMTFPPGKYKRLFTVQSFILWGHQFIIFVNDKKFPQVPIEAFLRSSGELYVDICSLLELVSHKSVMSKICDEQVKRMYARMK